MKYKTRDLEGSALDAAVAMSGGAKLVGGAWRWPAPGNIGLMAEGYRPSTNWGQGGPIIERELISLDVHDPAPDGDERLQWKAEMCGEWFIGHTPLIAAMRAYVASLLGEEVELP
jgi:hypothetical protein